MVRLLLSAPSRAALVRELLVIGFLLVATIVLTWPLLPNFNTAVSDDGDPLLVTWMLKWNYAGMLRNPLTLFHAPIFHPLKYSFAFSENLFGISLFIFPLWVVGLPPIVVYNVFTVLAFVFSGYGAYVLARMITGSTGAALAAGTFFAFVPYRFDHLAHTHHLWAGWLPLLIAALLFYFREPTLKRAALFGVVLLLNGLSNMHWFVFGSFAIALSAFLAIGALGKWSDRKFWSALLVAFFVAGLLMVPILLPYKAAKTMYGMRRWVGEMQTYSAVWTDWLVAAPRNALYGGLPIVREAGKPERALFPGLLCLLLGATALLAGRASDFPSSPRAAPAPDDDESRLRRLRRLDWIIAALAVATYFQIAAEIDTRLGPMRMRWSGSSVTAFVTVILVCIRLWQRYPEAFVREGRRSFRDTLAHSRFPLGVWIAILWVVIGVLGSLGANAFFYRALFNVEPFQGIRGPARWAMIAYVGLSVLVAAGSLALLRNTSGRWRTALAALLSLAFLLELRPDRIRWHLLNPELPPVYTWLATAPFRGAVLELPIHDLDQEYQYLLHSTAHHRPLINGVSGFIPPLHDELSRLTTEDPISPRLIERLEKIGCGIIVVHHDDFRMPKAVRSWLDREIADRRLIFLRRFDHGHTGDFVFAVARNEPDQARLRGREIPDLAGRTPSENLRLFLDEDVPRFYVGRTFGYLGYPKWDLDVQGDLNLDGWALSPNGIRGVNLRFENGAVVLPARLAAWPRLHELYPWYPRSTTPRFTASIPQRPRGVSQYTDLQVEIIDDAGEVTRLDQIWFNWLPGLVIDPADWDRAALATLLLRLGFNPTVDVPSIVSGRLTIQHFIGVRINQMPPDVSDEEFMKNAYKALLDRNFDPDGMDYHLQRLRRGLTREDVAETMLRSEEFKAKHLKAEE